MQAASITSLQNLQEMAGTYRRYSGWVFRGQADSSWKLVPKVGRAEFKSSFERQNFRAWKKYGAQYFNPPIPQTEWDYLALAQHHGYATRFLDWSRNPLVAAFFAVWEEQDADAAVFAYKTDSEVEDESVDPLDFQGVALFKPKHVSARVSRQEGQFTIHGPPELDLEKGKSSDDKLTKFVVPRTHREKLRLQLVDLGIDKSNLFPDLDGLSAHFNWVIANAKSLQQRFG